MKKIIFVLILSINSFLFAFNFSPYKGLDLGIKEEKLLSVLKQNNIQYTYDEENHSYFINVPDDDSDDIVNVLGCKNLIVNVSTKKRVYQIEFIIDSESCSIEGFTNIFSQAMKVYGVNPQNDIEKNRYRHENSYAWWKKWFYVIEVYSDNDVYVSMIDTRWVEK